MAIISRILLVSVVILALLYSSVGSSDAISALGRKGRSKSKTVNVKITNFLTPQGPMKIRCKKLTLYFWSWLGPEKTLQPGQSFSFTMKKGFFAPQRYRCNFKWSNGATEETKWSSFRRRTNGCTQCNWEARRDQICRWHLQHKRFICFPYGVN